MNNIRLKRLLRIKLIKIIMTRVEWELRRRKESGEE